MKYETSAGFILYYAQGKTRYYLLLQYEKGYWDFPKGHLEEGETALEAAQRELHEETGIGKDAIHVFGTSCYSIQYMFKDKSHELVNKTVHFFAAQSSTKRVTLSHEHCAYIWLSYRDALKKVTYSNAQKVLQYMQTWLNKHSV